MLESGNRAEIIFSRSGIPRNLYGARFDNYIPSTPEQKKAVEKCKDYALNCQERIKEGKGLFLYGPVGAGKTHLIVATLWEMVNSKPDMFGIGSRGNIFDKTHSIPEDRNAIKCRYYNVPEFLENIRKSYNRKPSYNDDFYEDVAHESKYNGLVILDDIGAEKPTEWVQEQLYRVIDYRYTREIPTFFTSNCTIKELEERIGARAASRIVGMTEGIKVIGPDYRKRKLGA